jgi:hypothetical protein
MLISEWGKPEVLFDSKNPFYFKKDGLRNGTPPFSFRERFQMTTSTIETYPDPHQLLPAMTAWSQTNSSAVGLF